MIEIICDEYGLSGNREYDLIVNEPFHFEMTLNKIREHSFSKEPLSVLVRNPALFNWFDSALKYGASIKTLDPIEILSKNLNKSYMPQFIIDNPHWIVELDLIKKSDDNLGRFEPVDRWLKITLLGEVWKSIPPITSESLSKLFNYFITKSQRSLHPLEQKLVYSCLNNWAQAKDDSGLFTWLKGNPFKRAKYILWEQQLYQFPTDKISAWLQQDLVWYELSKFPKRIDLPVLKIEAHLPESIAAFGISFLNEEWNKSPENALKYISGSLDFERKFLIEKLNQDLKNEKAITKDTFDKVSQLKSFPDVVRLAKQLYPAREPSKINSNFSLSEIQEWLAHEYLPYYDSCSLIGKVESTQPYIADFERWLKQNYTNMLFKNGMAYQQISKLKDTLSDEFNLLIIVYDGLDYLCACSELLSLMQENNIYPYSDPAPLFSFLPSQTFIAKPTLIAGKMKSQIPDEIPKADFYKELLHKGLAVSIDDIHSKTDRDCTLIEMIHKPAKVYLYLDNFLDTDYLHKNYPQYLRKKKYRSYMRKQSEIIISCIKDYKDIYGKDLQVVVCSDHGYTVIPKKALIIDDFEATNVKTRTIFGKDLKKGKGIDPDTLWELNPDLYGLDYKMIIPRGYSCFAKRPLGATHGGCTPQEIAVPWFIFNKSKPTKLKLPSFSFEGEIFRKRFKNTIFLSISNPNNYKITFNTLKIVGLESSSLTPLTLQNKQIFTKEIIFDATDISEQHVDFNVYFELDSLAGRLQDSTIIRVPTTGAMSSEFDDEFEF